jgi:preprotein translocase subunit SecE
MEGNSLAERVRQWPVGVKTYVGELQMEMRRVTWPSRKQVEATTLVVIFTVFAFAAYFFVIDSLIGRTIGKLLTMFARQ